MNRTIIRYNNNTPKIYKYLKSRTDRNQHIKLVNSLFGIIIYNGDLPHGLIENRSIEKIEQSGIYTDVLKKIKKDYDMNWNFDIEKYKIIEVD